MHISHGTYRTGGGPQVGGYKGEGESQKHTEKG